jgi:hypothetical protein
MVSAKAEVVRKMTQGRIIVAAREREKDKFITGAGFPRYRGVVARLIVSLRYATCAWVNQTLVIIHTSLVRVRVSSLKSPYFGNFEKT